MSAQRIHIVSFDVPYPADYGGVIDIYFTCRALTRLGAEVVLHCFQYGRPARRELLDIASEVHYYDRPRGKGILSRHMPYITGSRAHPDLLARLQQDQAPILFEGLHTTAFLGHPLLATISILPAEMTRAVNKAQPLVHLSAQTQSGNYLRQLAQQLVKT